MEGQLQDSMDIQTLKEHRRQERIRTVSTTTVAQLWRGKATESVTATAFNSRPSHSLPTPKPSKNKQSNILMENSNTWSQFCANEDTKSHTTKQPASWCHRRP